MHALKACILITFMQLGLPGLHFAAKESGKEAVKAAKLLLANGAKVDYTDVCSKVVTMHVQCIKLFTSCSLMARLHCM